MCSSADLCTVIFFRWDEYVFIESFSFDVRVIVIYTTPKKQRVTFSQRRMTVAYFAFGVMLSHSTAALNSSLFVNGILKNVSDDGLAMQLPIVCMDGEATMFLLYLFFFASDASTYACYHLTLSVYIIT